MQQKGDDVMAVYKEEISGVSFTATPIIRVSVSRHRNEVLQPREKWLHGKGKSC